jgi:transposase
MPASLVRPTRAAGAGVKKAWHGPATRVRRGMIQLAWRFLRFQKDSALAQWFRARTADGRGGTRKTMIVALARKLLIALWRLAMMGEIPQGVSLRPAA